MTARTRTVPVRLTRDEARAILDALAAHRHAFTTPQTVDRLARRIAADTGTTLPPEFTKTQPD